MDTKPSEQQIRALEKAHKQALVNLLQAMKFRYMMYLKLGSNSPEWKKYAQLSFDIWNSWYARQMRLEAGGATKEGIQKTDWLTKPGVKKLEALAKKWDATGQGIGFIPLLIWAVIALAGFFTAYKVTDELNTTTQEQEQLINATDSICQKYKFSPEECNKFMTDQTKQVSEKSDSGGLLGSIMKPLIIVGIGILVIKNSDKIFSKPK
jgi:hypothetical protein